MKKIIFLTAAVLLYACSFDSSNNSNEVQPLKDQSTWQQTISQSSDAIKNAFSKVCIEDKAQWEKVLENAMDPSKTDLMEVYGLPVYSIDTALWASKQNLPLESYLKLNAKKGTFYITYEGKPMGIVYAVLRNERWIIDSYSCLIAYPNEFGEIISALNANKQVISVNVSPQKSIFINYIFSDKKWQRADDARKYSENVVEDLRLGWNNQILNRRAQRSTPPPINNQSIDLM
ncbi:MAG: hypothetical protein J6X20_04870 [Bacteroidales bacterium]|nr:hypothetical protein [Bacteroidales bacterium]